jgi:hypothetical protein
VISLEGGGEFQSKKRGDIQKGVAVTVDAELLYFQIKVSGIGL